MPRPPGSPPALQQHHGPLSPKGSPQNLAGHAPWPALTQHTPQGETVRVRRRGLPGQADRALRRQHCLPTSPVFLPKPTAGPTDGSCVRAEKIRPVQCTHRVQTRCTDTAGRRETRRRRKQTGIQHTEVPVTPATGAGIASIRVFPQLSKGCASCFQVEGQSDREGTERRAVLPPQADGDTPCTYAWLLNPTVLAQLRHA